MTFSSPFWNRKCENLRKVRLKFSSCNSLSSINSFGTFCGNLFITKLDHYCSVSVTTKTCFCFLNDQISICPFNMANKHNKPRDVLGSKYYMFTPKGLKLIWTLSKKKIGIAVKFESSEYPVLKGDEFPFSFLILETRPHQLDQILLTREVKDSLISAQQRKALNLNAHQNPRNKKNDACQSAAVNITHNII